MKLSAEVPGEIQSPEHWFHNNIDRLNEYLIDAGVKDRVRTELFFVASERTLDTRHELRFMMDGWWGIWHDTGAYSLDGYRARMEIDGGLLHELIHQLGMIDIYQMILDIDKVRLPDVNRPMHLAGCGLDYWNAEWDCFSFPLDILDVMAHQDLPYIGVHTAGGLNSNYGHRRGFFGEYLFDTPAQTALKIVDKNNNPLANVELRFYQLAEQKVGEELLPRVDDVVEFTVTHRRIGNRNLAQPWNHRNRHRHRPPAATQPLRRHQRRRHQRHLRHRNGQRRVHQLRVANHRRTQPRLLGRPNRKRRIH